MTRADPAPAVTHAPPAAAPVVVSDEVADPVALILAGFGMTAILLSVFNAGILPAVLEPVVLPMALFAGGIGLVLAGAWAFKRNENFVAVVGTAYGMFWLSFATYVEFVQPDLPPADAGKATGLYLFVWALFSLYILLPALKTATAVVAVIAGTALTFLFVGLGAFTSAPALQAVGGVIGIVTGLVALYTSCAVMTNVAFGRAVLPIGPLS